VARRPGFMPKGRMRPWGDLNVQGTLPKGLAVEVLVTGTERRCRSGDAAHLACVRALGARQTDGEGRQGRSGSKSVASNRGRLTCDLEGLRLHSALAIAAGRVRTMRWWVSPWAFAFLRSTSRPANWCSRKSVQPTALAFRNGGWGRWSGQVVAVSHYGLFVDLGGVQRLLQTVLPSPAGA